MGKLDGKFSPDQFLSPERAVGASARLEMEKEDKQRRREEFLEEFDLDETVDEYSQNIPGFDKIKDQVVDELRRFADSKMGVNLDDPKELGAMKETLEKKFLEKVEEFKKAS